MFVDENYFKDLRKRFKEFSTEILRDLIPSVFELEKYSFFPNRSEFRQKSISTNVRGLVRHPWAQSGIENQERLP